jgi:hypothetical protein
MTTIEDLYPGGRGYHCAHEAYIGAVAKALDAAGFPTAEVWGDPNDPRDGWIGFDMDKQGTIDGVPIWSYDEVGVGWSEDRGWHLLFIDDPHGKDSRFVDELAIARVASPVTVVLAVGEKAGLTLKLDDDGHPDADFPAHTFEDDDLAFEAALAHYREVT